MRHILVFPALNGCVDFERQEQDISKCWYRAPRPQWISILLPQILAKVQNGQDLTLSTWRQSFGFSDPSDYVLPAGDNFQVRLFCPMGEPFQDDNWGQCVFHNSRRPPTDGGRFIVSGGGLRLQLEKILNTDFVNSLRQIGGRPRLEVWVRHGLRMCGENGVAPGVHPIPRILEATIGLDREAAAAKIAAMRAPTSNAEWYAKRLKDQAEKLRKEAEQREDGAEPAELHAAQAIAAEMATEAATAAEPAAAVPDAATSEAPAVESHVMTREDIQAARKKREKMAQATRSKVSADAANKAHAEAWANKRVGQLEKAGKLGATT